MQTDNLLEMQKEDRKDNRLDMQTQGQMQMIQQRKQGDSLNKFESSGNDIITGDAGLQSPSL